MERREVKPSQIYVQAGSFIDFRHAPLQDSHAGFGRRNDYRQRY